MLSLSKNMRATDTEFASFLEDVGNGVFEGKHRGYIQITKPGVMVQSEEQVINEIYPRDKVDLLGVWETMVTCRSWTRTTSTIHASLQRRLLKQ